VILAIEQRNAAGGVNGRPIELVIKDDQHDPDVALHVDQELIDAGVVAIIGHMTSAMSVVAAPLMNQERMLMISPTTSTSSLTGLDDYFLRVTPPNTLQSHHLAHYLYETLGLRRCAGVYDLSNREFSEDLLQDFIAVFETLGGQIVVTKEFTSGQEKSYMRLAQELLQPDPDCLLIVAGALDTAMICQQIRKLGSTITIASSAWAQTMDLIRHGGSAVEGILFSQRYGAESSQEAYLNFRKAFQERFGRAPDFSSEYAYEAATILFQALEKAQTGPDIKANIVGHTFHGLKEDIQIDQYGDTWRKRYILTVKDGQFSVVE
jgi:branched-chain amino acid transport system substrate-binding protein